MKTVCRVMGLARSHIHDLHHGAESWRDGGSGRTPATDAQLLSDIREQIAQLPSYGYRRACALVNRQRAQEGAARVDPKRGLQAHGKSRSAAARGAAPTPIEPAA